MQIGRPMRSGATIRCPGDEPGEAPRPDGEAATAVRKAPTMVAASDAFEVDLPGELAEIIPVPAHGNRTLSRRPPARSAARRKTTSRPTRASLPLFENPSR